MPSFDRALADGCDGFEFDVRLTADRQTVVCHDAKIGKLQIARARAGQLTALPRLDQVLARYRNSFLDIEIKVPGLEQSLIRQLREFAPECFVVSSFLPEVLTALQALDPGLPLGLICQTKRQLDRWHALPVQYVIPHYEIAGKNLICELHEAEKKVLVWTVNRAPAMRKFARLNVEGIISDDTKLLCATLGPKS